MDRRSNSLCSALMLLLAAVTAQAEAGQDGSDSNVDADKRPNFLIVVADDLGWSDIGAFGGEIRTPTLNELAKSGTVMTDYYVAPTCSPTRSMLLTGLDNHQTGVGTMHGLRTPNQPSHNYAGQLHNDVVTVAEALQSHGYQTMLSGKWHLGVDEEQYPGRRGFDRSFGLLGGGASHFADKKQLSPLEIANYFEDGQPVELPGDFYSSIGYTDKILEYLQGRDQDTPFFAFLAYTAPHDPIQVPDEWLDKYQGAYSQGPLAIRESRAAKAKSLGLINQDAQLWRLPDFPSWFPVHNAPWLERSEELRLTDARPMEVYAAMVELMDQQLGRVVSYLQDRGELENTYVIFFSDNGASATAPLVYPGATKEWLEDTWSIDPEDYGRQGSFTVLGGEWASAANSPWRLFKGQVAEGGIRSPLIVRGPSIPAGTRSNALAHVSDITPTLLDIAGIDAGTDPLYKHKLTPQGSSLLPAWMQQEAQVREWFGTELFGNRVLRRDNWKISWITRPLGSGAWELFDLAVDPGETNNLAGEHPRLLAELITDYEQYMNDNGVVIPDPAFGISLRKIYNKPCDWWCELRFKVIGMLPTP